MSPANRQVRLRQRPVGLVDDATFEVVEEPLADLAPGEYRVRIAYLSIDPTNRVWIREEPSYLPPVQLGEVMRGGAVGEVVESRNDDYPVGAPVLGMLGWQEYATCGPDDRSHAQRSQGVCRYSPAISTFSARANAKARMEAADWKVPSITLK